MLDASDLDAVVRASGLSADRAGKALGRLASAGHYTEPMVNLILGHWHADTAMLRRYLVDEGFLDRRAGRYWRSGGTA